MAVRFADGGGHGNVGMAEQAVFDFAGADTVAAGGDDVVVASDEADPAFVVALALAS